MEYTQDEIAAIIGSKELELIWLRRELARKDAELEKLKQPHELKVVKADGAA